MSAPEFDPELVEQVARIIREETGGAVYDSMGIARAVLTAAAPILIAKGAGMNPTSYEWLCGERDKAYQRGKVDGAREVLAAVEAEHRRSGYGSGGVEAPFLRDAREAVAHIEKEN